MTEEFSNRVRLVFSKAFAAGTRGFEFGRYCLDVIPSGRMDGTEAVLAFGSTIDDEPRVGAFEYPEGEAGIVCDVLALILDARIETHGCQYNYVEIRRPQPQAPLDNVADASSVKSDFERITTLDIDLARQFSRSCRAYASALGFIASDPTFAFFLLVVAVECLASQPAIIPITELSAEAKCERFCRLIARFSPDEKGDEDLQKKLLKTVYYVHRSGFVHGGKRVSNASEIADREGLAYIKHLVDGKEVRTPGLLWFRRVVRDALLGYLRSLGSPKLGAGDRELLANLAREDAVLHFRARKAMAAGRAVTLNDVEHQ